MGPDRASRGPGVTFSACLGDVPVMCSHGGYSPSQGGDQNTPGHWDCLRVNCGLVFANTVRF